jgi:SPP1 family predicted phage head-tail adaptor
VFYMNAGELRHSITIQHNTSDGTTDPNWQDLCTIKAAKKALTGKLLYQAAAEQSVNNIQFVIRYRANITPSMRILYGTFIYEIIEDPIDPDDQSRWLQINARRISQNGN